MKKRIKNVLKKVVKGYLRDIYWDIYGKMLQNPKLSTAPASLVFVCKGNICRSPFAQFFAMRINKSAVSGKIAIDSAGLEAKKGNRSPENAVLAAREYGIDLGNNKPKRLGPELISVSDMVITMEAGHLKNLHQRFPEHKDKFFLLPLFENNKGHEIRGFYRYNIPDPYGKSVHEFRECFRRIERCVEKMFDQISRV